MESKQKSRGGYDPQLRMSEAGRRIYPFWKKVRNAPHAAEFRDYADFYGWAIHNGYTIGSGLHLLDDEKPYSPENCIWVKHDKKDPGQIERDRHSKYRDWIQEWNRTVNRLRLYFGLEPFPVECEEVEPSE